MKGPAKLSLAISLALIGGNALALGLGSIQVKSKLNQPLVAEIPVMADSPAEINGINVGLASAEDFQRVGLDRSRVDVPLEFAVGTDSRGQTVIKVTTHDVVREPLLDFLVAVNWPKGKLLREYTVLLDPPVTVPAAGSASVSPAQEAPRARTQPLPPEHPKAKSAPITPPHAEVAQAKPAPKPSKPAPAPPVAHAAAAGEYGPVAAGETLSEIAGATRPDDTTNMNEMMLALLKANPNAFFQDNINALKRGAILRIPSRDEIKASGSAAAAAAAVREQNQSWASNAPVAKPTLVAKTGAPKVEPAPAKSSHATSAPSDSHLALVPPHAGKGGQNSSDHPGASSGTGNAQAAADLARTRESLASREQEVTELKSRVKDLTKINDDGKRLLALKQNEIAELQEKLKQLQADATKAAAAAKAAPVVAPVVLAKAPETKAIEVKPTDVPAKSAEAAKEQPKLTAKDIWGNIGSETPSSAKPGVAPTSAAAAPVAASTPPPGVATVEVKPVPTAATTPAVAGPAEHNETAAKPVESKPVSTPVAIKPKPTPKIAPLAPASLPWWQNNNILLAGGGALLVIGLLALMRFMRKPKLAPAAAMEGDDGEETAYAHQDMAGDEQHLLDQLAQSPGDPHVSLQLLDLYYAQGDASKFEATAEAMYAHIADPTQPEWQQARAMGEHLCPHNPLFSPQGDMTDAYAHEHHAEAGDHLHDDAATHMHDAHLDGGSYDTHTDLSRPADDNFDFDLTDHAAAETPVADHATAQPAHAAAVEEAAAAESAKPADDFFAGEDAIGTKLDLAKAYLDMGDPEGARSMLDEVLAEGNDAQKIEARKLLAEIG
jgi:pilus assembly protein FimV